MEELGAFNDIINTIQYENISSTYNFSLIISAINTVQDASGNGFKILATNRRAYPFSALLANFIKNYYAILSEEEFIPQKPKETRYSKDKERFILREYLNPIIYYYQDNNKKENFYKDLRSDFIPKAIQVEWELLIKITGKLIVSELMKGFGSSVYDYNYSFLKPEINIISDNYEYPSCSYSLKYFSIPEELNNIFIDSELSSEIKDMIYQLWTYYTSDLKQDLDKNKFESLLRKTSRQTNSEKITNKKVNSQIVTETKKCFMIEDRLNIQTENPEFKNLNLKDLFNSPEDFFAEINENITTIHISLLEEKNKLNSLNAEIELYNRLIDENYKDLADIPQKYNISGSKTEEKIKNIDQILNLKSEINNLSEEREALENKLKKNNKNKESNEEGLELIKKIDEDIEGIQSFLNSKSKPFAYTNEPVKRFLTYSGDIAEKILYESISLLENEGNHRNLSPDLSALPPHFVEGYNDWSDKKEVKSNREVGKIKRNSSPTIIFDKNHGEFRLLIPQQNITSESDATYVQLFVYDNSGYLCDKKLPLYEDNDGYNTEETEIILSRPSDIYIIEILIENQCIKHFKTELFKNGYAAFNYDNLKIVKSKIKTGWNYIVTNNNLKIRPWESIIEQGKYYGSWSDYTYYLVDFDNFKVEINSESPDELSLKNFFVDLYDYNQLDSVSINDKPVLANTLPKISIKYQDLNLFLETVISIHPSGNCKLRNTKIIYLKQYFKDNRFNLPQNGEVSIDLSDEKFICKDSVSTYIVRIRNKKYRTDQRFEFTYIPSFNMKYDQQEYFSENSDEMVNIDIISMSDLKLEFEDPVSVNYIAKGHLALISPIINILSGKIKFNDYTGDLSLDIPVLSWRFENPDNSYISPKYNSFKEFSEQEFYNIGDHKILSLFSQHLDENQGYLVIDQINEIIPSKTNEGKISFDIFKHLYKINSVIDSNIKFSYLKNKNHISNKINLFNLNRWVIKSLDWTISEESGDRIIILKWKEKYDVPHKNIIIWKAGINEVQPQHLVHKVISGNDKETEFRMNKSQFTQGIYYIQFIPVFSEWQTQTPQFPGEKQINLIQKTFELGGEEILEEADILLENGKYFEAIDGYRRIEKLNPKIKGLWKQKIQNRLIYTHKFEEALNIVELISNKGLFESIDKIYATQLIFVHILPFNEYLFNKEYIKIFDLTVGILNNSEDIQKLIICNKKEDAIKSIENCKNLDDEEREILLTSFRELYSRI